MRKLNISLIGLSLFACTSAIFADDCTPSGEYTQCCYLDTMIDQKGGAFDCLGDVTANYKQARTFVVAMGWNAKITCKYNSAALLVCKGYGDYKDKINKQVVANGGKWAGWYLDSGTAILELTPDRW